MNKLLDVESVRDWPSFEFVFNPNAQESLSKFTPSCSEMTNLELNRFIEGVTESLCWLVQERRSRTKVVLG